MATRLQKKALHQFPLNRKKICEFSHIFSNLQWKLVRAYEGISFKNSFILFHLHKNPGTGLYCQQLPVELREYETVSASKRYLPQDDVFALWL